MLKTVTPVLPSEPITKLCSDISPGHAPVYVDVTPDAGSEVNECFQNVGRRVASDGGCMVIGWSIWETPNLFVEAEFHAVWSSPTGDLVDVTPKPNLSNRILFLPQPGAVYSERQVNNIRYAIADDTEVEAYFRAHNDKFEFLNRGVRAEQHGMVSVGGKDLQEYDAIANRLEMYEARLAKRDSVYSPYLPCWCGSGKKAKWCHKSARLTTNQ
jgi:hypothetical protein